MSEVEILKAVDRTQPGALKEELTKYLPEYKKKIKAEPDKDKRAVMRIKYRELIKLRDEL